MGKKKTTAARKTQPETKPRAGKRAPKKIGTAPLERARTQRSTLVGWVAPHTTKRKAAVSAAEQVDLELAGRALQKRQLGQVPTARETAALRRVERAREEETRRRIYSSVPQKHYRELSGRQTKVLREQAERYGIPFDGRVVDLAAVLTGFHDLLAEHGRVLLAAKRGQQTGLKALRAEKVKRARLERLALEGSLIPREEIHDLFAGVVSPILRTAGETLKRRFGGEAADVHNEALEDIQRSLEGLRR